MIDVGSKSVERARVTEENRVACEQPCWQRFNNFGEIIRCTRLDLHRIFQGCCFWFVTEFLPNVICFYMQLEKFPWIGNFKIKNGSKPLSLQIRIMLFCVFNGVLIDLFENTLTSIIWMNASRSMNQSAAIINYEVCL